MLVTITGMGIVRYILRVLGALLLIFVVAAGLVLAVPNVYEYLSQKGNVHTMDEAVELATSGGSYDCILVLGASMQPDGTPSTILKDRLDTAIELYNAGVAPKIIMSGDDESDSTYDEVTNMKKYVLEAGVPSEDVFCDHAGINTYDSMYRAYHVFGVSRMVVVTQTYHQYRALFDASSFHIEAIGVTSDRSAYAKQSYFEFREFFARIDDMYKVVTRQNATYLSEPVSLSQSGDVTTW